MNSMLKAGVVVHPYNPSLRRLRQEDCRQFEAETVTHAAKLMEKSSVSLVFQVGVDASPGRKWVI